MCACVCVCECLRSVCVRTAVRVRVCQSVWVQHTLLRSVPCSWKYTGGVLLRSSGRASKGWHGAV